MVSANRREAKNLYQKRNKKENIAILEKLTIWYQQNYFAFWVYQYYFRRLYDYTSGFSINSINVFLT